MVVLVVAVIVLALLATLRWTSLARGSLVAGGLHGVSSRFTTRNGGAAAVTDRLPHAPVAVRHEGPAVEPSIARPVRGEDPWVAAARELERARRYEHPLSLVRIACAPVDDRDGSRRARERRRIEHGLREAVRECDLVWSRSRYCYALLTECDREGVAAAASRLAARQPTLRGGDVRWAVFPHEGLTLRALQDTLDASPSSVADEARR